VARQPHRHQRHLAEAAYRRAVVERCMNRLEQWRGLATRYEKRAANYWAMLVLAAIIWLDS
jgi:transposase